MRKLTETLTPAERAVKRRELQTQSVEQSAAVRAQVDQVLTSEQLTAVRSAEIGMAGGRLLSDATFRGKIGLSDEQWKELSKQLYQDPSVEERAARSLKENRDKTIAVISPKQWEQVERLFSGTGTGGPIRLPTLDKNTKNTLDQNGRQSIIRISSSSLP